MIKQQEWADWLYHPVTRAVIEYLESRKDELTESLLDLDIASKTTEQIGLHHLAYRSKLDGLGECLDVDGLRDSIVEVIDED